MGFRSTFTTEDYAIEWPDWFVEKYEATVSFPDGNKGALHSRRECKIHLSWSGLVEDVQRAIEWRSLPVENFVIVFLHECGGISRCQIEAKDIKWSEPGSWDPVPEVSHSYCYGCSDA